MSIKVMSLIYDIKLGCALRKAVALKLADCSDDAGRNIWPAVETIADKAEISVRSVQNKLAEMVAAGLLRVVRAGGGRNSPTHYEFNLPLVYALAEGRETFADRLANGAAAAPFAGDGTDLGNGAPAAPFIDETPQETTRNPAPGAPEPSGTVRPPKSPKGGPSGKFGDEQGTTTARTVDAAADADSAGHQLALLRAAGRHADAVEHLLAPLAASGKRLSLGKGRALREALAELAARAHGIPTPALAAAVSRIVAHPSKATAAVILREIDHARQHGEMLTIRAGSPEWAAWQRHLAASDPRQASAMSRSGVWMVRRRWPDGVGGVTVTGGAA